MAFERAVSQAEIPSGAIREVRVGEKTVAVAHVEDRFYAIDNVCLHRGGPLGQGELKGSVVTCPWHGWQYEVSTGQVTFNPDMCVKTYPVELRGEEIWVDAG